MNRISILKTLLIILCFFSSYSAKSQITIEWEDPRRFDSVMVLDLYEVKNESFLSILDIAMNMSNFFQFGNDMTQDVFYKVSIRGVDDETVRISIYPQQTSEITFFFLHGSGYMPNGMLIYKDVEFLITYWHEDSAAVKLIDNNFVITDNKSIFIKDPRNPKYITGTGKLIKEEGFSMEFNTDISLNSIWLMKSKITPIEKLSDSE